METEEFDTKKPLNFVVGTELDDFSVAELERIVVDLNAEITRIRLAIERKKSDLSAADSLFKSS